MIGGVAIVVGLFVWPPPRPIAAAGTLDECSFHWPVIELDDAAWHVAFPRLDESSAPRQLPVLRWPAGLRYDEPGDALLDAQGQIVFRAGDAVRFRGTIVDMSRGDIPPCFFVLGVDVESIAGP